MLVYLIKLNYENQNEYDIMLTITAVVMIPIYPFGINDSETFH